MLRAWWRMLLLERRLCLRDLEGRPMGQGGWITHRVTISGPVIERGYERLVVSDKAPAPSWYKTAATDH